MNTGKEPIASKNGLLTTLAASVSDEVEYALEGSVFVAGAAIQWLRDEMRMIKTARQSEEYADEVPDCKAFMCSCFYRNGCAVLGFLCEEARS